MIGAAGAALAAAPYLANATAWQQLSGPQQSGAAAGLTQASAAQSHEKPLVLVVKGDKILGYRGFEEIPLQDASLASMLNNTFRGASN